MLQEEAAQIQWRKIYYWYVRDCKFTDQKEKKKVSRICVTLFGKILWVLEESIINQSQV